MKPSLSNRACYSLPGNPMITRSKAGQIYSNIGQRMNPDRWNGRYCRYLGQMALLVRGSFFLLGASVLTVLSRTVVGQDNNLTINT